MRALLGEPGGGGSFFGGPECNKRKALETETSLYGGSVGRPGVGSSTGTLKYGSKGLWRWGAPLCGSSVKET
jgi:hypothetical protein